MHYLTRHLACSPDALTSCKCAGLLSLLKEAYQLVYLPWNCIILRWVSPRKFCRHGGEDGTNDPELGSLCVGNLSSLHIWHNDSINGRHEVSTRSPSCTFSRCMWGLRLAVERVRSCRDLAGLISVMNFKHGSCPWEQHCDRAGAGPLSHPLPVPDFATPHRSRRLSRKRDRDRELGASRSSLCTLSIFHRHHSALGYLTSCLVGPLSQLARPGSPRPMRPQSYRS